jgi:hypothetical protein
MPIYPRVNVTQTVNVPTLAADEATPFDVTLAVPATAEDLVLVPGVKVGRNVSIINEGPGDAAIRFDATATTTDVLIREGEGYADQALAVATKVSFINVTAAVSPRLRGVLWSGPAA